MPTVDGGTTMLSGSFVDRGPRVSQEGTLVGYLHIVRRSAAQKSGFHGAKDPTRRWSAVSPGRKPRGLHGRSCSTEAIAGPVPFVDRRLHSWLPYRRRLAG